MYISIDESSNHRKLVNLKKKCTSVSAIDYGWGNLRKIQTIHSFALFLIKKKSALKRLLLNLLGEGCLFLKSTFVC